MFAYTWFIAKDRARSAIDPSAERHIFGHLGFPSVEDYQLWCEANSLPSSVRKSDLQRRQECELFQRQAAQRALRTFRQSHNPSHAITRIFLGEIDEETVVDEPLKIIAQACRKHAAADGLRDYLIHIDSASKLLTSRESTHCRPESLPVCARVAPECLGLETAQPQHRQTGVEPRRSSAVRVRAAAAVGLSPQAFANRRRRMTGDIE